MTLYQMFQTANGAFDGAAAVSVGPVSGLSLELVVENNWLVRAASLSCPRRCSALLNPESGRTAEWALSIGRPRSPGKGGPSCGMPA